MAMENTPFRLTEPMVFQNAFSFCWQPLALHISVVGVAYFRQNPGIFSAPLPYFFARHSEMILQHWKKEVPGVHWGPRYGEPW